MNKQVWIEKALGLGIQEFEIYQSTTVEKEMTWFQGQMDTLVSSKVTGTSIRGIVDGRSEERRVGKECRSRWSPYH